jgi:hypothetical protein
VVLILCALSLHAAPPQLTQTLPLAVAPGKTVDLALSGQHLLEMRGLWTSFAARCEFVAAEDEVEKTGAKLRCRLTVPRDEQVGISVMRAVSAEGVSNPILLMIDDLRSVPGAAENFSAENAQQLDLPIAVDGQCDAVQEDMYRFYAAAGQRLSFEVVSQRLGSKLDSVMRLMTADGQEIGRVDDTPGVGGDSRLSHTFEANGDYLLAISDVRHQGGADYRYRLRIGTFPLITAAYPAGGRSGEVASFQLIGKAIDQTGPVHVRLPTGPAPELVSFGIESAEGGSGWFQVEANPGEQSLEQEPNNVIERATVGKVPGSLNGRLEHPGDRDYFRVQANKGQRLRSRALTRELGSPCDLYLSLHRADGSRIAEARQERETVLDVEIPDDGEYLFQVEDLNSGGSAEHIYRIDVEEKFFGFSLHAENMQYVAPHSGTVVVKVLAQRSGYDGPIELAVEGLGEGVKLEGNTLVGAETLLRVTLPPSVPQGSIRLAKIIGSAKVGEQTFTVTANQRGPLLAMFPNALSLPTPLEETVAIGVGPPFAPYFDLVVAGNEAYFPQLVGTSTFEIEIKRTNEAFKDEVALTVDGLPEGVTAEIAKVDDGLKAYRVTLNGPAEIEEGTFPIRIVGTARFQEQSQNVTLDEVNLRVTKPLVVSLNVPGPIPVGGSIEAEILLRRFAVEPEPVRVQVSDGPAGLLAPIFVDIPADSSQAKISLNTTSAAVPGKYGNLTVVASTTVQGQNITVTSAPVSVEIQPPTAEPLAEGAPAS